MLLVDKPFSGDSRLQLPIILEACIHYIMMMYTSFHTLNIFNIIFIYERLNYGIIFRKNLLLLHVSDGLKRFIKMDSRANNIEQ